MDQTIMRDVSGTGVLERIKAKGRPPGGFVALIAAGLIGAACSESTAPAPPAKLAFIMQPGDATAGVAIAPNVAVAIEDASGNVVSSETRAVTLTIEAGAGGGLPAGPVTVSAVDGIATFSNLRMTRAGTGYTLKAMATGLTGAESAPFDITAGPPASLLFATQPSNTIAGGAITPPVAVTAQDTFGNRVTTLAETVTVALAGTWPAGTLAGTTAVMAVNGVATFTDLSIALGRTGAYQLIASSRAFTSVASVPFSIGQLPPPTATLRISTQTTGSAIDPDGFSLCIDKDALTDGCSISSTIAVNNVKSMTVGTGVHTVLLTGVAGNCTIAGGDLRTVHAATGETVAVQFDVSCAALTLRVTTTTTGDSFDPAGAYQLCVDPDYYYGCSTYGIGVNSSVSIPTSAGSHSLELRRVPRNCLVSGDNPRGVMVNADTQVTFTVACAAPGSVRVTAATSGTDLDLNGYEVCIASLPNPCFRFAQLAADGTATLDSVPGGSYTVTLGSVAQNCAVSGGAARAVTVVAGGTLDLSFDVTCTMAERIAFVSGGTITVMRADGSSPQALAPGTAPAWSPDGTRLAYECGQDICVIAADGTGSSRLTFDAATNHDPAWSPDGLKIAFAAKHGSVTELYVMAASGSGMVPVNNAVGFQGSPAWSPDGSRIVFDCRVDAGNDDICAVNQDGTGFARLTTDPARDFGAVWKPDGSSLAFATARYSSDGTYEIVLMSSVGGSVTRIGAGLEGFSPTWSPDGTQLAFVQLYFDYYYGGTYYYIAVAGADGSSLRTLTLGDQPSWKPHP